MPREFRILVKNLCRLLKKNLKINKPLYTQRRLIGYDQLDGQHGRETHGDEQKPQHPLFGRYTSHGRLENFEEHHVHERSGRQPLEYDREHDHDVRFLEIADQRAQADAQWRRDGEQQYRTVSEHGLRIVRQHLQPNVKRDDQLMARHGHGQGPNLFERKFTLLSYRSFDEAWNEYK